MNRTATLDSAATARGEGGSNGPRPPRRGLLRQIRSNAGDVVLVAAFGAVVLLLWELLFRAGLISPFILPPPVDTLEEVYTVTLDIVTGGFLLESAILTMQEIVLGFAIAAVSGVALGVVLGETTFGRKVLMPYVVAFNAMPKVAFAPLFVAWLGFGTAPKVLLAAVIAFFPIVINTAVGIESFSVNALLLFRSMEASRWQTLWKLKFPTALPYIFAGLRTASVLAVIGAVVAEFLSGGRGGLGTRINIDSLNLRTDRVFALIIILSIMALAVYGLVILAERRIIHWRESQLGGIRGRQ